MPDDLTGVTLGEGGGLEGGLKPQHWSQFFSETVSKVNLDFLPQEWFILIYMSQVFVVPTEQENRLQIIPPPPWILLR
jgi:hypothetical protein